MIARTNALKPDVILITGDLFDNANPKTRAIAAQLNALAAPAIFTSGNHEAYLGTTTCGRCWRGPGSAGCVTNR